MPARDDADRDDADGDDLVERLDELDSRLGELRAELVESETRRPLRPPTPRELLRFTEEYTIPTVIAVLEANIRALRLLQRALRLADPERALREESRRAGGRGAGSATTRAAADRLTHALDELGSALSEADLPEDSEARPVLEDVRALRAEIADRIRESGRETPNRTLEDFAESDDAATPVSIPVEEGTDEDDADGDANAGGNEDVDVDVEAELESIREEVSERGDADEAGDDADRENGDESESR